MGKGNKKYDVFISYRRDGGEATAKIIRDELQKKGYRVFFDVETLRSGKFNEQLLDRVANCNDFIIICSPGAFDRCCNEDDWVRRELSCAIKNKRNIIPVMLRNFEFPPRQSLPEELRDIVEYQGVSASFENFDASMQKLVGYLTNKPQKLLKRTIRSTFSSGYRIVVFALLLAAVIGGGIFALNSKKGNNDFPHTADEKACVDRLLNYSMTNLGAYDAAYRVYETGINELIRFTNGTSSEQKSYTFDEYAYKLIDDIDRIVNEASPLEQLDSDFMSYASPIIGDKINLGEAEELHRYVQMCINGMKRNLENAATYYVCVDRERDNTTLLDMLNVILELASLEKDAVYYGFNDLMINVTDKETYNRIIKEYLPALSTLSFNKDWITDRDALDSKENAIDKRMQTVVDEYREKVDANIESLESIKMAMDYLCSDFNIMNSSPDDVISNIDVMLKNAEAAKIVQAFLDNDMETAAELYDEIIFSLTELKNYIISNRELIAQKQEELERRKSGLRDKYTPLPTDSPEDIWEKGLIFLSVSMIDDAKECFKLYAMADKSDEGALISRNAVYMLDNAERTGIYGGCILYCYDEEKPPQKMEIGDIIYRLNGTIIRSFNDYIEARGEGVATISLLRFHEDGTYEIVESEIDPELSKFTLFELNRSDR